MVTTRVHDKQAALFTGYSQTRIPDYDHELALTGPGTPCGEYFRRYWHPVALCSELGELPLPVRVLGEDLVLFRTTVGKIGLVHRQCPHRRASLVFGKCEDRGVGVVRDASICWKMDNRKAARI